MLLSSDYDSKGGQRSSSEFELVFMSAGLWSLLDVRSNLSGHCDQKTSAAVRIPRLCSAEVLLFCFVLVFLKDQIVRL